MKEKLQQEIKKLERKILNLQTLNTNETKMKTLQQEIKILKNTNLSLKKSNKNEISIKKRRESQKKQLEDESLDLKKTYGDESKMKNYLEQEMKKLKDEIECCNKLTTDLLDENSRLAKSNEQLNAKLSVRHRLSQEKQKQIRESFDMSEKLNKVKQFHGDRAYSDLINDIHDKPAVMIYISYDGSYIFHLSLPLFSETRTTLPNNMTLYPHFGFCRLPDGDLFIYGGLKFNTIEDFSSSAYRISCTTNEVSLVSHHNRPRSYLSEIMYHEDSIYIFGGLDQSGTLHDVERYNLRINHWRQMSNFPVDIYWTSCTKLDSVALVLPYNHTMLFAYEFITDSYKEISNLNCAPNSHKIVFTALAKVYILTDNRLYESLYDCELKVIDANTGVPNQHLIAPVNRVKLEIYFMLSDAYLYRFDLKKNTVQRLSQY